MSGFWNFCKEEFAYVWRAYFVPITFLWVLATKGPTLAKEHWLSVWNSRPPTIF